MACSSCGGSKVITNYTPFTGSVIVTASGSFSPGRYDAKKVFNGAVGRAKYWLGIGRTPEAITTARRNICNQCSNQIGLVGKRKCFVCDCPIDAKTSDEKQH